MGPKGEIVIANSAVRSLFGKTKKDRVHQLTKHDVLNKLTKGLEQTNFVKVHFLKCYRHIEQNYFYSILFILLLFYKSRTSKVPVQYRQFHVKCEHFIIVLSVIHVSVRQFMIKYFSTLFQLRYCLLHLHKISSHPASPFKSCTHHFHTNLGLIIHTNHAIRIFVSLRLNIEFCFFSLTFLFMIILLHSIVSSNLYHGLSFLDFKLICLYQIEHSMI